MNTKLSEGKCVSCEGGVPPIKGAQLEQYKKRLDSEAPGWELRDPKHLQKEYKFKDFKSALEFVEKVGQIAEEEGHHPNIEFGWGFARILLWTHAIDRLSENDFFMAAKIDQIEDSDEMKQSRKKKLNFRPFEDYLTNREPTIY